MLWDFSPQLTCSSSTDTKMYYFSLFSGSGFPSLVSRPSHIFPSREIFMLLNYLPKLWLKLLCNYLQICIQLTKCRLKLCTLEHPSEHQEDDTITLQPTEVVGWIVNTKVIISYKMHALSPLLNIDGLVFQMLSLDQNLPTLVHLSVKKI